MVQRSASVMLELTQQSGSLTRLASDLGRARQKVRLYGTFVSGLHHCIRAKCGMYSLPQARLLANKLLKKCLHKQSYWPLEMQHKTDTVHTGC